MSTSTHIYVHPGWIVIPNFSSSHQCIKFFLWPNTCETNDVPVLGCWCLHSAQHLSSTSVTSIPIDSVIMCWNLLILFFFLSLYNMDVSLLFCPCHTLHPNSFFRWLYLCRKVHCFVECRSSPGSTWWSTYCSATISAMWKKCKQSIKYIFQGLSENVYHCNQERSLSIQL